LFLYYIFLNHFASPVKTVWIIVLENKATILRKKLVVLRSRPHVIFLTQRLNTHLNIV